MSRHTLDALAGAAGRTAFLIGAGGSGMRGLAGFLLTEGWQVWGADRAGFEAGDALLAAGLRPVADDEAPPQAVSLVIRSAAVPETDLGWQQALQAGACGLKYAQMLGCISRERPVLAVAGSHGKTTCTAWIAYGLRRAGVPVGYLVGAHVPQLGGSADWGDSSLPLIVESCEFDRSFLELNPESAVLLNVDAEHPDTYPGGLPEVTVAFAEFLGRVSSEGRIYASPQAPDLRELAQARWVSAPPLDDDAVVGLPGVHQRHNAAVVAAVLQEFGLSPEQIAEALSEFHGASRRMEFLGECEGAKVFSDYAHHPTEIAATLQAARERMAAGRDSMQTGSDCAPAGREHETAGRLIVVFQPHQAVRFRAYRERFAESLIAADRLLLFEVFRARDPAEVQASVMELLPDLPERDEVWFQVVDGPEEATRCLRDWIEPNDWIFCLGAGDIDRFARSLVSVPTAIETVRDPS